MATSAFATPNTTTQTAPVNVSVASYVNISAFAAGFSFNVTDGGFSATYASNGLESITATANTGYTLHASVGGLSPTNYTILTSIDGGTYASSPTASGTATTNTGVSHTFNVQLQGNTTNGLAPDNGSSGLLTVTITAP